jgi:hypothetical protein
MCLSSLGTLPCMYIMNCVDLNLFSSLLSIDLELQYECDSWNRCLLDLLLNTNKKNVTPSVFSFLLSSLTF